MGKKIINSSKFWKPNSKEDILLYKGHFNFFESDKHVHEDYTITIIQDGNMNTFIDGFSQNFNKSIILTINPDKVHSCKTNNDIGYKYNSIYFKQSFLENIFQDDTISKNIYFRNSILNNPNLHKRFTYLVLQDEKGLISKLDFECEFIEILKEIFVLNSCLKCNTKLSTHDATVGKAKEFINENFEQDLSLDDIVKDLGISKYHFIKVFKEKTHVSPYKYLMLKRVDKARHALQTGESLVHTAYQCGFNDQSHLNRHFKAIMGLTPKTYKNFF